MLAFVLSGGGNRGAAQIGALAALMDHGIAPDLIVGTSAGALNGVSLAVEPTRAHAQQLCAVWRRIKRDNIFPGNPLTASWRILTSQGSLHDRRNFRRFVQSLMPGPDVTFRDLKVPSVVTATVLSSGHVRLFGPRSDELIIDALMASTAIPPFFAPYYYQGEWLVDGAVATNLPLNVAVAHGARTIYALEIVDDTLPVSGRSVSQTMAYAVRAMISQQHESERRIMQLEQRGITVHPIRLTMGQNLAYNDFRSSSRLIDEGYRVANEYVKNLPHARFAAYQRMAESVRTMFRRMRVHHTLSKVSHV